MIYGTGYEDIQKAHILSGFTNVDEVLKSEHQEQFEDSIKKGEVDVISQDDIRDTYSDTFFKGEDVRKFEDELEGLIKKGEDNYLTEDEWEYLAKGRADVEALERKAVAIEKGGRTEYHEVFVAATPESGDED